MDFPKYKYHEQYKSRIVNNEDEESQLGSGWVDSPAKLKNKDENSKENAETNVEDHTLTIPEPQYNYTPEDKVSKVTDHEVSDPGKKKKEVLKSADLDEDTSPTALEDTKKKEALKAAGLEETQEAQKLKDTQTQKATQKHRDSQTPKGRS